MEKVRHTLLIMSLHLLDEEDYTPPPSLSTFLTVTCHSPVNSSPRSAGSDGEMNIMPKHWEKWAVCRGHGKKSQTGSVFFSKMFKGKKLLASRSLPIHLLTYAAAILHTRYAHLGSLPHLFLATLSLNGVVFLPCCWITFSAAHCHCMRNPLNPLFLLWPTSLCLGVFAIMPSLSGGSTE